MLRTLRLIAIVLTVAACASAVERQRTTIIAYDSLIAACPEPPVGALRFAGEIDTGETFTSRRFLTAIAYVHDGNQARGYFVYRDATGDVCQPFNVRIDRNTFRFRLPSVGGHGPAMVTFRRRGDDTAFLSAEREDSGARISASGVLQQIL